jgi:hypothetical protein
LLRPRAESSLCPHLPSPQLLLPQEFRPQLLWSRLSQPRSLRPRASIKVGPSQTAQQIQWAKPAIRALGDNSGFFGLTGALPPCRVLHGRNDDLSACRGQQQKQGAALSLANHPLTDELAQLTEVPRKLDICVGRRVTPAASSRGTPPSPIGFEYGGGPTTSP